MRKLVPAGSCVPEGMACNARGTAGHEASEPANSGKSPDMCGENGKNGVNGASPKGRNGELCTIEAKHPRICEENGENIEKVPGMCKESGRLNTDERIGPQTYTEIGAGEEKSPGTCHENGSPGVANDKGAGRRDKDVPAGGVADGAENLETCAEIGKNNENTEMPSGTCHGNSSSGVANDRAGPAAGILEGAPASAPCPDLKTVSTAALAYLGDAVIEVLVRRKLVAKGLSSSKALNRGALDFVRAPAQAAAMERLLPFLTSEEQAVFRRGRNIGHTNTPKNATVAEYRSATGMEALFGYLYLSGSAARATELFFIAYREELL